MLDALNLGDNTACYVARRNCSASPKVLVGVMLGLGLVSIVIASGFALSGAWVVFPFTMLELAALAVVFVCYARHATDYERIRIDSHEIEVEVCDGSAICRHHFNQEWARLVVGKVFAGRRLALRSHGREVEIGRFLDDVDRARLERELRRWLRPAA
ncbi:MAG TPA: DUF2244 domain-containing protein [Rhodocyclaceae bacterium]|jgi:uncharacterized membrane protein|nr:DUF2244 domain-containing protein [Rhodocyclaceae bacterium]HMV52890.1 DUF2244 domain-containing protein [Rhodocyclaceae bacterium]HMZ83161.1 DUF2244 domain-containing protein [Rhodocyclaceae bacterium]HNB79619.1 DUF2244 domain-containing protein [Rhodocyclaceae bacterium]HNC62004.1 DUF2244 domain-containing protein [Rhodocyclaceae bacterium]